jgi:ABC-2 type transport system permease protein
MRLFFVQLGWELRRLVMRPQTWLAFALSLAFELAASLLLKVPSVRADIARDAWKMRARWNEVFSGLTTAAHIMGESFTIIGALGIALVAAVIVAGEDEEGTLRMIFCRPVSRTSVLAQKWIACALYAAALTGFIASSTLAICLIFEGPGNLVLLAPHEGVMGTFHFAEGMRRYALALPLMWFSGVSGMLWPFFFSCTGMKPAAATILSLTLLATDDIVRTTPETAVASPYCVTTRMLSWRQVFNDDIPWPRIQRNYTQLTEMDVTLIVGAWVVFRRRECKR